ncbi:MAG TPA: hypothetical protein VHE81_21855, partial [Lacipirellulaceae bacterium]|nr:hypothetical protein [Lacipirellulaceae bacterium]
MDRSVGKRTKPFPSTMLYPAAFLCFFVGAVIVTKAKAGLIDYEPFDYSGAALNGQNGGEGWSGGWFITSSTDNRLSDDGVSLSYPVGFEAPLATPSTAGSRVGTGGLSANASSSRLLSQTIPLNVDGTVRYASALIRKNAANGGGVNNDNILLEFVDSSGNRRWGVGIEGNGDKPWLNANGSTTPAGPAVTPGDTYFLVAKIVSSASGTDTGYLKVFGTGYSNEVPITEPTTWDAMQTETTGAILDRIRI